MGSHLPFMSVDGHTSLNMFKKKNMCRVDSLSQQATSDQLKQIHQHRQMDASVRAAMCPS